MSTVSIIVPILNEANNLPHLFTHIARLNPLPQQIILVDGGSHDDSLVLAQKFIADLKNDNQSGIDWQVIKSQAGRARQMNKGASLATGDILLFLHADTKLPTQAVTDITTAIQVKGWGRFDVRLDSPDWTLKLVSKMINYRSRLTSIATGDQAIFIKRELFEQIGGYPNQALMEDVEISKRLKSIGKPVCLKSKVITSARRWEQHGTWRTIVLMWQLRFDYWRGVSADNIWQRYYQ
ncbi:MULTISPECIES: TIGR04283 family arsenosugar biosynthesis glycosyltransferase [unclassified Psychrobacter]|uniref:TIGR04283 family arsenosugar biosynthesis glycosyltransferase n=1 Tax=unclassified Psychrobacter TaxID=196806 RepID=UPI003FD27898